MNEEHHYQVLKHLAANPQATQRVARRVRYRTALCRWVCLLEEIA